MKSFHDKVVVITGAGSGIGRALACEVARRGALLAAFDVDAYDVEAEQSAPSTPTTAEEQVPA